MASKITQVDTRLTDVHRKTLMECRPKLVHDLDTKSIIDDLLSKWIITDEMRQEIQSNTIKADQTRVFLDKLLTRDIAAFDGFLDILRKPEIGCGHLADMIQNKFHELTFGEATKHVALANKVDPKDLHDDNFALAKKSVSEIVPMVQELKVKYKANGSGIVTEVKDTGTESFVKGEKLPQDLVCSDQPNPSSDFQSSKVAIEASKNQRPSLPGLVAQPESAHLFVSGSESETVGQHKQLERVPSTLDTVEIKGKKCDPRLRYIWNTAFFSNGFMVKIVTDKDSDIKALLCDNECNILKVLVEKSVVWHAICSPTDIAAVTCKSNVAMVKLCDIKGNNIKNIELPQIQIPSRLGFVDSGKSLLVVDNGNNSISQVHIDSGNVKVRKLEKTFQSIDDMAVNDRNYLYVADCKAQSVKCFRENGKLFFDYNKELDKNDKFYPTSVCVDSLGYIVIADTYNHHTKLLHSDGSFLRYLTKSEDGIVSPLSVTMNHNGQLTVVTHVINKSEVYIVKYRP